MLYHEHKSLDLKLSKLSFGGAALSGSGGGYGFGEIGDKNAQALIEMAIERGVNHFDTAPIYGFGNSEKRLGQYLSSKREKVYLTSKCGITWHSTKRVNLTNDPKVCIEMLHQSLKDLNSDYIDFYLVHWPDPRTDIRHTVEALAHAQLQGKIKFIGLCNTNSEDIKLAQEVCSIDILQAESNLFSHHHDSLNPTELQDKITMGWGTFDKGILSGSVHGDSKFSADDARSWAPWWKKSNWRDKVVLVEKLSKDINHSIKHMALQFSLLQNATSLCGMKSTEQLEEVIKLMKEPLEQSFIEKVCDELRK